MNPAPRLLRLSVRRCVMTATADPPNDLELIIALVANPTASTGELTALLGLPDVPDDDGGDDARD